MQQKYIVSYMHVVKIITRYYNKIYSWFLVKLRIKSKTNFDAYLHAITTNKEQIIQLQQFSDLIPRLDNLYDLAIRLTPDNHIASIHGRFLLICHKCFLSSAALISQAQIDDAGPITRRAIEVVRLAAAFREDPNILDRWTDYERRIERWNARQRGERPARHHVRIEVNHPIVRELMDTWGIISDSDVHFTPEHYLSLNWEFNDNRMKLNYFEQDIRNIKREIILLTGTHGQIISVFDWCFENIFSRNEEFINIRAELNNIGRPYANEFNNA